MVSEKLHKISVIIDSKRKMDSHYYLSLWMAQLFVAKAWVHLLHLSEDNS